MSLDIYAARDPLARQGPPEEAEHLGSISLEEWTYLTKHGFLNKAQLDFFSDGSLIREDVLALCNAVDAREEEAKSIPGFQSTAVTRLKGILRQAIVRGTGVISVAD